MKHFLLTFLAFICLQAASAANDNPDNEIKTMLHNGHTIEGYKISYDERYLYTRGDGEICVWDIRSLMLAAVLPMNAASLYPHPADSRLLYVKERGAKSSSPFSSDYALIDWTDGSTVGYVSSVPIGSGSNDLHVCRYNDDLIALVPMTANPQIAGYIGGFNINIGSARTNHNDSLLATSGMLPQIWDLRHASLADNIPYYRYLRPDAGREIKDIKTIKKIPFPKGYYPNIISFCESYFLPDSDDIILGGVRDTISIWRPGVGLIGEIPVGAGPSPALSIKGDTIIAATAKGIFRSTGRAPFQELEAFRLNSGDDEFNTVSRPYGNGRFLAGSCDGRRGKASVMEGSFASDAPLRVADKAYGWIQDIKLSPREDYAAVTYGMQGVARLDLTGDTLRYGPHLIADYEAGEKINRCEILRDETIVAGTTNGTLHFWKKGADTSFRKSKAHHAPINSISLSNDSTRMFTSDRAGQITIWDTATLEPIMYLYQVLGLDEPAYILLTPDYYYKATPNAHKFINFVKDGQTYGFEQFDLRNNRPDIVLERLGGSPEEIALLKKAWQKRLRRAGIAEQQLSTDYHVPVATVTNRNRIPSVTSEGMIALEAQFSDSDYNLAEISVTLNGVPVAPPEKRRVEGVKTYRLSEPLALASGNNEIVVSCLNEKGSRSMREVVNITYSPPEPHKPDLYVVAVGVSDYASSGYDLNYADKDAADFADMLSTRTGGRFGSVYPLLLTNGQFTETSFATIGKFLSKARRDDVIIAFYAGHGVLDSQLDYYLATHDMDFANPSHGGIPYDDFIAMFDGTESVNRYCFIDACHSGELDKEDYLAINTVAMPEGEELIFRGTGNSPSIKDDVRRVNDMLSDMFLDLRWGTGVTVLSSAGGAELAVESPQWKNGLFTYCLKKGLETDNADADGNGKITLKEWINFASQQVAELSEGRQSPTLRSHNYHNDLLIK